MKLSNERLCARTASVGLLLAGILAGPRADAAWDFVPNLNLTARSEDNPYYVPDNLPSQQQQASSMGLDTSVQMATYNQRSLLLFEPRVVLFRYTDNSNDNLNGEDWYFKGSGQYQWTTVTAGFDADYRRQRLVTGEFGSFNYNLDTPNPDTGDTGRTVAINQYRDFYYATPYVAFTLSPRNTLRLDVTHSNVSYSGADLAFRTGYGDTRYAATLQRNTDQQTQISAVMSVEDYNADINTNSFHTVTVEGQFARPINQLWSFRMTAGVLRSDFDVVNTSERITAGATTDYVVTVGFRKRSELANLNAEVGRDVYPSSSGYSVVRRQANLYGERNFTQRFGLDYGVLIQDTKTLGNLNSVDDRNYADLELNFDWALRPVLFLIAGIEYQYQEFPNDILDRGKTTATTFSIGVRYRGLSKRRPPRPFGPSPTP
jgi:hypothetical protein